MRFAYGTINEQIVFTTTASAVNEWTATNAATGGSPTFAATGGDTNITPVINPKGTGIVQVGGLIFPPQSRISISTGVPVMNATVSGATTIYYTPYVGQLVPLYDGTRFHMYDTGGELSQATTDNTKSPAAVANNSIYDMFVWNDSGTMRCTRGPAWTNDTTRSAGTALTRINGILLNNTGITNGPAANRGTYVGSVRSNGSAQIDFIYGASASGGTASVLYVWNMYNQVLIGTTVTDSGVTYTYTSSTIRQARASAGNQISFLVGLETGTAKFSYSNDQATLAAASAFVQIGVGFNTTSGFSSPRQTIQNGAANAHRVGMTAVYTTAPTTLGAHIISANERSDGTNANNFDQQQEGQLSGQIMM